MSIGNRKYMATQDLDGWCVKKVGYPLALAHCSNVSEACGVADLLNGVLYRRSLTEKMVEIALHVNPDWKVPVYCPSWAIQMDPKHRDPKGE